MKLFFTLFRSTYLSFQSLVDRSRRVTHRHSISNKINYGYGLTLTIAVVGTTAGIILGDHYQQKARAQEEYAQQEIRLLNRLGSSILQAQTHQQQLIYLVKKPEVLQREYSQFLKYSAEANQLWSKFISNDDTKNSQVKESSNEIKRVRIIRQIYQGSLDTYIQRTKEIFKQINPPNLRPEEFEAAQQRLWNFNKDPQVHLISHLSDDLDDLLQLAYEEQEEAEASFSAAEAIRVRIIAGSILISVVGAILLALYNTQTIVRPIQAVTAVAQRVTKDGNFDLQTPVTTEDEVGVLAVSLNSLIRWIGQYTEELELARQTLEMRVEERTQELSQKNQQLLQTHNQLNQALQNLQQAQVQLIQTEKMSSLGQLVAGVAHEINNPLNFISNNIEHANNHTQELLELVNLYQRQYPNPAPIIQEHIEAIDFDFIVEDIAKILASMKMGAERMNQLVLSLRNFSRLDEAEVKPVNIYEGIESTLLILNHQLKHGIEVIKQYEDLPLVECYPAQLNQVFMNILQNAIDALETETEQHNKQIVIKTQRVAPNQIKVQIRDNGSGIPAKIKAKIFDPFFTTKGMGKGTGLGLSIGYQIINKHQGKIEVNSQLGEGTEFAIYLPIKQLVSPTVATSDQLQSVESPSCQATIA